MNRLLARLEPGDYDALMAQAKVVPLKFRKRLHLQDEPIEAVFFPLTCMVSLLVTSNDKPQMEMATVGNEGVVGASELLQAQGAMGLNLIQIPGSAVRIDRAFGSGIRFGDVRVGARGNSDHRPLFVTFEIEK